MKTFFNKFELVNYVASISKLDLNATLSHTGWYIVTETGVTEYVPSFTWWLDACNRLLGTSFDKDNSRKLGSQFVLYENKVIEPEVIVDVVEDQPVVEDEVTVADKHSVDWDYVYSIKDTKKGKQELDLYAEGFGIKLNKAMKLENMRRKFKELYEEVK